ncbi:hypothetical protein CO111_05310, partial [Candidatus Desantisbacteria bacterium CG_4_9_14_3_um_filter_50_7]
MDETKPVKNIGWRVALAGMGINLAFGVLYTWSVISKAIPAEWGWKEVDKSWPYSVACLVFALMTVPGGRLQDKIGARIVATVGGIFVGIGMILASFSTSPVMYIISFGIIAGAGIGFGYASATPPALKWFSAKKTGLISGIVVSGFGLASAYASPLSTWLIGSYGVQRTMLILGVIFLVAVVGIAQLLKEPPKGYQPQDAAVRSATAAAPVQIRECKSGEMLGTGQFYLIWFMYACGAGAGLMIIGKLAAIAKMQAHLNLGFVLVIVLACGNGAGRILAGMISDKIGCRKTLFICLVFQALLMMLLSKVSDTNILGNMIVLSIISALIGANYGANLSLFPSHTKSCYGLKNFGSNYGFVFT